MLKVLNVSFPNMSALDSGIIFFSCSSYLSGNQEGTFVYKDGTAILSDNELLSIEDGELYMRTDRGMWRENPATDPDAQNREGVCRYYTLKVVENPNWATILQGFRPIGYNPEDFGMK